MLRIRFLIELFLLAIGGFRAWENRGRPRKQRYECADEIYCDEDSAVQVQENCGRPRKQRYECVDEIYCDENSAVQAWENCGRLRKQRHECVDED